jgi:hypothetical protein
MNWKTVSLVLLVLLVVSSFAAIYEYSENLPSQAQNADLKQQLNDTSQKLIESESEVQSLQQQLSETNIQVAQLETNVTRLQQQVANQTAQIEKFEEELKLKNYTVIGLSFMWNPVLSGETDPAYLRSVVKWMNDNTWDPLHIYFFVAHAGPESFIPITTFCLSSTPWDWRNAAIDLHPGNDIPIAVVRAIAPYSLPIVIGGCACTAGTNCPSPGVIAFVSDHDAPQYLSDDASTLTGELLHVVGGIPDSELLPDFPHSAIVIPLVWYPRIQVIAKQYETSIPADYQFP